MLLSSVDEGVKSVRSAWSTVVGREEEVASMSGGYVRIRRGEVGEGDVPIMARRYFPDRVVFVSPIVGAFWVTGWRG